MQFICPLPVCLTLRTIYKWRSSDAVNVVHRLCYLGTSHYLIMFLLGGKEMIIVFNVFLVTRHFFIWINNKQFLSVDIKSLYALTSSVLWCHHVYLGRRPTGQRFFQLEITYFVFLSTNVKQNAFDKIFFLKDTTCGYSYMIN